MALRQSNKPQNRLPSRV